MPGAFVQQTEHSPNDQQGSKRGKQLDHNAGKNNFTHVYLRFIRW